MTTDSKTVRLELLLDGYYHVNPDIKTENFPVPETIETENWKCIKMDKPFTSDEAVERIAKEGCRPANIYELAMWKQIHGDVLKKFEFCVAFGQIFTNKNGYRRVPCILRNASDDFRFSLAYASRDWSEFSYLLAFPLER
jgi:hypothetical protein